jgi:ABC-type multidrug transport system ATPase subunit
LNLVPQFDYLIPSLTVLETLQFQAQLRLPENVDESDRNACVQEVIKLLALVKCANIPVGNDDIKGISGGEKRRLSIAIQLLLDPVVCLLDEPTTGLDAFTARHIVKMLKALAEMNFEAESYDNDSDDEEKMIVKSPSAFSLGSFSKSLHSISSFSASLRRKTVIMSIHQPRYDILQCVDEIVLLSRGCLVWAGSSEKALLHFQSLGYECPLYVNLADFLLDITSLDVSRQAFIRSSSLKVFFSFFFIV